MIGSTIWWYLLLSKLYLCYPSSCKWKVIGLHGYVKPNEKVVMQSWKRGMGRAGKDDVTDLPTVYLFFLHWPCEKSEQWRKTEGREREGERKKRLECWKAWTGRDRKTVILRLVEGSDGRGTREEAWEVVREVDKMGEERGRGREREESHEAASLQYFIC